MKNLRWLFISVLLKSDYEIKKEYASDSLIDFYEPLDICGLVTGDAITTPLLFTAYKLPLQKQYNWNLYLNDIHFNTAIFKAGLLKLVLWSNISIMS